MTYFNFPHRRILCLQGPDRYRFLQGLVSCDVVSLEKGGVAYGAFLTPQGKFLEDLFLISVSDKLYIDSYAENAASFYKKLQLYKLKSDVTLTPLPEAQIFASFDQPTELTNAVAYKDPRHHDMGWRIILLGEPFPEAETDLSSYDQHRYALGIPDGARDMPVDKAILLEYGFDEMKAIDWDKGCYLGQELTARTKYRGVIRKRLVPFTYEGETPEVEASLSFEGNHAGEVRAAASGKGLALLRLSFLKKYLAQEGEYVCGTTKIKPFIPPWMQIDFEVEG